MIAHVDMVKLPSACVSVNKALTQDNNAMKYKFLLFAFLWVFLLLQLHRHCDVSMMIVLQ